MASDGRRYEAVRRSDLDCLTRAGRNLDLGLGVKFAANRRGEQPHGLVPLDIGKQCIQVGAGLPEPASSDSPIADPLEPSCTRSRNAWLA